MEGLGQKRNNSSFFIFLIFLVALLFCVIGYSHGSSIFSLIDSINISKNSYYRETEPPEVLLNNTKYQIPPETKQDLWKILQKSPINPKTGKHVLSLSVFNVGMMDFALWCFCSMKLANFTKNGYVFVATDIDAYNQMKELNPQTIYLPANFTKSAVNNIHMEDFAEILKIRPVLVHQLLLWDAEVIYTDIDIVFLEDPISSFNDEADFEVQSDSDRIVKYNTSAPVVFLPNMGYFKVHPTPIVLRFFKVWLQKFFSTPKKHEQTAFYDLLKPLPMEWINDDTFQIQVQTIFQQTEPLHLKIRYLDPVYFTNAGSAFKNGRELWVNEAHRRNITKPKLVHFFHIGFIREKRGFVTGMQMSCVTKEKKCKDEAPSGVKIFPIWRRNQS